MPQFAYSLPLEGNYQDSVYTATILYPEFVDMTTMDVLNYRRITQDSLPVLPEPNIDIILDRKRAALQVHFCPLVHRGGRYQILVSFMLRVDAKVKDTTLNPAYAHTRATSTGSRYADHSEIGRASCRERV